jgi:hypothetical protein
VVSEACLSWLSFFPFLFILHSVDAPFLSFYSEELSSQAAHNGVHEEAMTCRRVYPGFI